VWAAQREEGESTVDGTARSQRRPGDSFYIYVAKEKEAP
jgi:hypothetical protein